MKTYFGCPGCGSRQVKAIVTLKSSVDGTFVNGTDEFESDQDYIDDFDMEEIEEYECTECDETFDRPVLIYDEQGPRLRLRLSMEVIHTKCVKSIPNEDSGYYVEDEEKDGSSRTFSADISISSPEAAEMAMEAGKAFFHTMLIKQGQKKEQEA